MRKAIKILQIVQSVITLILVIYSALNIEDKRK